jgi:hypothetical protein
VAVAGLLLNLVELLGTAAVTALPGPADGTPGFAIVWSVDHR